MDKYFYASRNGGLDWRENYKRQMLICKTEEAIVEYMAKDGFTISEFNVSSGTAKEIVTKILMDAQLPSADNFSDESIAALLPVLTEFCDGEDPRKDFS